MRSGYLGGALTENVCVLGALPVHLLNESVIPCEKPLIEPVVKLLWQSGPAAHGGLGVDICDTAICASGAATQPLSPIARPQARIDKQGTERFNGIEWFLKRWADKGVDASIGSGAEWNRMRRYGFRWRRLPAKAA